MHNLLMIIIGFLCVCCGSAQRELVGLLGREIIFPDALECYNQNDESYPVDKPLARLLVYYDSLGCNTCRIQNIRDWDTILCEEKSTNGLFVVQFIFTPHQFATQEVPRLLRLENFLHPFYLDKDCEFQRLNSMLIQSVGRVSLLDKNNKIILVGSPLYNSKLWGLYRKTIHMLVENHGVLPDNSF